MIWNLRQSKLKVTKAGFYLLMFAIGLASSSFFTGTNILFLLDFFLFCVLLFNWIYLIILKRHQLSLEIPNLIQANQDFSVQLEFDQTIPPVAGQLFLEWERFGEKISKEISFLRFSESIHVEPIQFEKRGVYKLNNARLVIEFPFPLLQLKLDLDLSVTNFVYPRAAREILSVEQNQSKIHKEDDLHRIRRYSPGDPIKSVAWKHTARHGKIMVRQMDVAPSIEQSYVIQYNEENERAVFGSALALFKKKMNGNEAFSISGKSGQFRFDGRMQKERELLLYLASYQMGSNFDSSKVQVLGGAS